MRFTVSRTIGSYHVALEEFVDSDSGVELTALYSSMLRSLHDLEVTHRSELPLDPMTPQSATTDEAVYQTVEAKEIYKEVSSGRTTYKVRCGPWQKFGVRIWPEVLTPFMAELFPDGKPHDVGESIPVNAQAVVKMNGDKPVKVIKLTKAAN